MKKQSLFLLGGSPLQVDLLRAAKERYHTIVIDGNVNCALRSEADEFVHLDFSDTERLYDLALAKNPALILTMASEPGNLAAAVVSNKLDLKYNPVDVVYATINKIRMKEVLFESGLPTSRHLPIMEEQQRIELHDYLDFPLVVKPSQSSAGRGVKLVHSMSELETCIIAAKEASRDGCALIEEFIPGDQYSVETISCEGNHNILGITREHFGAPPFFAETQQLFPANLDPVKEAKIKECVSKTLDAFGIQYGACHIELRVTPENKLYIIEIASRIGGWRSELIRMASGVEYAELLLKSHESSRPLIRKIKEKYCLVKMIFSPSDLAREKQLRSNQTYAVSPIIWLKESIGQGQSSLMDSAGYYFVEANNLDEALEAL